MKQVILNHFGFSRLPFGKDIGAEEVFETTSLSQAGAMLELGLDSEDIMLITGPIGCGKSLIVRHAAEHFDTNRYQLIYLRGDLKNVSELFKLVLRGRPEEVESDYSLCLALIQSGRLREGIGHLESALRLDPEHAASHDNLGLAQLDRLGSECYGFQS